MSPKPTDNIRQACLQQLESDLFLGAKSLPFDKENIPRPAASTDASSNSPKTAAEPGDSYSQSPPASNALLMPEAIQPNAMTAEQKRQALAALEGEVKNCQKCPLSKTRTNVVFGQGNPSAELVFVGEAPGYYEDQQGLPFVGRAGKLLDDILTRGMGLSRDDVYICNVLKCRPPENRDPGSDEMVCCLPFLERQLEIIAPKVICCLGRIAAQCLLNTKAPMKELRGHWHSYRGIKTMVTYHTAYLLRNPADKKKSWMDIQQVMAELGLNRPK